jgi:RNA-binding protein
MNEEAESPAADVPAAESAPPVETSDAPKLSIRQRLAPDDPKLAELKARAHHAQPLIRIGHDGVTEKLLKAMNEALDHHELVKVKFMALKDQKKLLSRVIEAKTDSVMVQRVGHTATYWRGKKDAPA